MSSRSGQQQSSQPSSNQQYTQSSTSRYRSTNDPQSRAGFGGSRGMNFTHRSSEDEPQNIMYDRRVIRGSTLALRRQIENRLNDINSQTFNNYSHSTSRNNNNKNKSMKKRSQFRRKNNNMSSMTKNRSKYNRNSDLLKSPQPVHGRLHAEIQTDPYLEQIYVKKHEKDLSTQTDPFLDRPSTPLFIPKLSGKCVATQIEDGDLFDFDKEVEPILEVLIGKTIEQSLMEVLEEEELKSFAKYKAEFQQKRNQELVKCQRLEEEQRRANEEKQRRIKQAQEQKEKEELLQKRIEAQRIATEFLENIEDAVFEELDKRGHFYDPIKKEIETVFMPKLLENVEKQVNDVKVANMIMDEIINGFVMNMVNEGVNVIKSRDDEKEKEEKEAIYLMELEEKLVGKRKEFTQAIKAQKEDYDFKEQLILFLDIPLTAPEPEPEPESIVEADDANADPSKDDENEDKDKDKDNDNENENEDGDKEKEENEDKGDDDNKDAEENQDEDEEEKEPEIPPEIQANIEYIDNLVEQFGNDEEPLWKQISSMLDKIDCDTAHKIERIDEYLQKYSIKLSKKELLGAFEIYKEDEDDENLKKAIMDCLGVDTFNEEIHNKYIDAFKTDEQKNKMECIDELTKEKEDIKQFIESFIKQKQEERRLAEEEAKAKEAAENEENEDENENED